MMKETLLPFWALTRRTFVAWYKDNVQRLGAALAFYTIFAIAPLFIISLTIASWWFGEEAARRELYGQFGGLIGPQGSDAIQKVVASASKQPQTGVWATFGAVITFIVGATSVFVELQDALNQVWGVRRRPGRGMRNFVRDRLLSFAMILGIGFLLLVSLIMNAALAALGKYMSGLMPAQEIVWQWINFFISFGVITLLFAMIFKILPDVRIAWRDVWVGAVITALLFNLGKFLLSLYLGKSSIASAYGAAGSLVIILLWVYYSSQILFLGAEFTQAYANQFGAHLRPVSGAEFVAIKEEKTDRPPAKT